MSDEYFNRVLLGVVDDAVFRSRSVVPGKVREVTSTANGERVVKFEPGIGRREGGEEIADGPVPRAPVLYPSGGGWSDVWPVDAGDEALGLAADRNTERWKANRVPGQAHSLHRSHDLSDVLVMPYAISPANAPDPGTDRVISNERGEVMRLGLGTLTISTPGPNPLNVATIELTSGGSIVLTVATGKKVKLGGPAAVAVALGQKTIDAIDALLAGGVPVPGDGGAGLLSTMTTAWDLVKVAILAAKAEAE